MLENMSSWHCRPCDWEICFWTAPLKTKGLQKENLLSSAVYGALMRLLGISELPNSQFKTLHFCFQIKDMCWNSCVLCIVGGSICKYCQFFSLYDALGNPKINYATKQEQGWRIRAHWKNAQKYIQTFRTSKKAPLTLKQTTTINYFVAG